MDKGKRCSKCKEWRVWDDYYADKRAKDGKQSQCRACMIKQVTVYQRSEHGHELHKNACRRYSRTDKALSALRAKRAANPDRYMAQCAVNNAVQSGKLPKITTQKCVECEGQARHYHHPNGYGEEHRLDIIPVCIPCHSRLHI